MKFKIGDKVKVVATNHNQPKALIGNIYTVITASDYHYILNTTDAPWYWQDDDLELVKPKVEEKRAKLCNYCSGRSCIGCPLTGDLVPCGRGYSFRPDGRMPDDKVLLAYDIVFGGKDMKKDFTKADLKNGDVVKYRNGVTGIICLETGTVILDKNEYMKVDDICDDLTYHGKFGKNKDWDIIAVRRPKSPSDCRLFAFDKLFGELVYERKEVEEMTLEEVCKALGKEIKIVKK